MYLTWPCFLSITDIKTLVPSNTRNNIKSSYAFLYAYVFICDVATKCQYEFNEKGFYKINNFEISVELFVLLYSVTIGSYEAFQPEQESTCPTDYTLFQQYFKIKKSQKKTKH